MNSIIHANEDIWLKLLEERVALSMEISKWRELKNVKSSLIGLEDVKEFVAFFSSLGNFFL